MIDQPVHTETHAGFLIEIFPDFDPQSPITEFDMAGEFVRFDEFGRTAKDHCNHYSNAPDKDEFLYAVRTGQYKTGLLWLFQVGRYQRLTWWLFKGSDIENEAFDGFYYLSPDVIRKEWGMKWTALPDGSKHRPYEMAKRYADGILGAIRDYYEGDVYGYIVSRIDDDGDKTDEIDSCWGFIGDYEESGCLSDARSIAEHEAEQDEKAEKFVAQFMQC